MDDLTSMYLDDAIKNALDGLEEDDQGQNTKSIECYQKTLESLNLAISFEKNSILQDIIRSFLPNFDKRICTLTYGIDSQTPHRKRPFRESDVETDQFLEINTPMATPNDKITPRVDEVLGLDVAKSILREAIVLPRLFPDLFKTTFRRPWTKILLYGPPGTGKTKLCEWMAQQTKCTLVKVTAASLLSCWFGETEKAISQVFQVAEQSKPSILFLDEIDSLMRSRSSQEDEATRRIKNEFLTKMDQLTSAHVFIIACTNRPWDLDSAFVRRFEKKLYIPLPCVDTRRKIFQYYFEGSEECLEFNSEIFDTLATKTHGLSGADLVHLIQEAGMKPIRELQEAMFFEFEESKSLWIPSEESNIHAIPMSIFKIPPGHIVKPRKLTQIDIIESITSFTPTTNPLDMDKFEEYAMYDP